jgi:type III secretion protein F
VIDPSNALTFDYINSTVLKALNNREIELRTAIEKSGNSPSTVQLLDLQQQVQQWTMMAQIQGTLAKEISDAMKGVIQKAG